MAKSDYERELERRILYLETKLKHLTNDLWVTGKENETATASYLEIHLNMEKIIDDRTKELTRAAEELRESEEKYRTIFDNIQDVYFESSLDGVILEISPSIERISKYKREELIGKSLYDFYTNPDERDELIKVILTKGRVSDVEVNLTDKDGSQNPGSFNILLMVDEQKNPLKFVGSMRDISERKQAEMALRESEEIMRSVLETSPVGIAIYDETGQCFVANDSIAEMIGTTKKQVLQQNYNEIESWQISGLLDKAKNVIKENVSKRHEVIGESTFGQPVRLDCYLVPFASERLLFMAHDITKRILAEEALQEKTYNLGERVKELNCLYSIANLIAMPDITLEAIFESVVEIIPPSWQYPDITCSRILIKNEEYKTENFRETEWKQDTDIFVHGEKAGTLEIYYLEEKPKIDEGSFLKEERNLINGIAERLARIIERVQAEEEKEKLQNKLQEAQKMEAIGTLAGGIAHQFNNALSPISVNLDMLEMDYPGDGKIANYTKQMKDSAHRMAQLTNQLLAYAKGGKYQAETIAINDFLDHTLPIIHPSINSDIRIETDLATEVQNIKADRTQMQMVLSAILTNASEAIEGKGFIRITANNEEIDEEFGKCHSNLKPGSYVCLRVEDNGKGMDKETRSRIFEPFFTTKFEGRGLGMASVFGIVRNHDGWISVYSEIGKGTVIRIYLPLIEARREETKKPTVEPIKGTGTILRVFN